MAIEAVIQVALDGAGKMTKTLVLSGVQQPDGTIATVYIPDVVMVDKGGRRIDFDGTNELLEAILKEVRWVRKGLGEMTDNAYLTLGLDDGSGGDADNDD